MKIRYFAWLKNITRVECEEINNGDIIDINTLKKFLCKKYPDLEEYIIKNQVIRIAVNLEYISENKLILSNDEIALFPQVSGG